MDDWNQMWNKEMKYAGIDISPSRLGTVMDINFKLLPCNSINLIIEKKQ